jgi:hypothetical protein
VWKKIWEKRNFSRLDREAWRLNWNSGEVDEVLTRFFFACFLFTHRTVFFIWFSLAWTNNKGSLWARCSFLLPSRAFSPDGRDLATSRVGAKAQKFDEQTRGLTSRLQNATPFDVQGVRLVFFLENSTA